MIDKDKIKSYFVGGSIRGDAAQIYIYQFLGLGFGLISSIVIARTLGPTDKGIVDLFNLLNSFILEFGLLGFGSGLLYYLAKKGTHLKQIHGTGLVFSIIVGILTGLVGWLGLPLWRKIFPGLSNWIILLAFSLSPLVYYRLIWSNIMTGINQAVASFKASLYFGIVNVPFIVLLWLSGRLNVQNVIALTALFTVLNAVVFFGMLYKREPELSFDLSLTKGSLNYGLIIYLGVIANVLHFKIDQVMINYWLGTRAVGLYAMSVRWAEMLFLLDSAILSAAFYRVSSASNEESYALTKRLFKVQLLISGGSGVVLALLAYPLVLILYGSAYHDAALPLILLIPGIIAWSVAKILSNMLVYNRGMASTAVKIAIFGSILNILLNLLFIRILGIGIVGSALASSISYSIVALLTGFRVREVSVLRPS